MVSPLANPSSAGHLTSRWASTITILILIALIVLERSHTYTEAPDRDIAGYAVIGHEMLHGRLLYSDLWERKPPLLYATFALAEVLVGYGPREIFVINITAACVTLLAIYSAGAARDCRWSGLLAGGLWVLLGGDLLSAANQPNAEALINACLAIAFAFLIHPPARPKRTAWAVIVGVMFAAATFYKHHAVVVCVTMMIGHVVVDRNESADLPGRRGRWRELGIISLVLVVAWVAIIGYFTLARRFDALVEVLVRQNMAYSGNVVANLFNSLLPRNLFPPAMHWMIGPLCLLFIAGIVAIRSGKPGEDWTWRQVPARWRLWFFWLIGSWVMVAVPGTFLAHYYQLLIPPICVAGGWAASAMLRPNAEIRSSSTRWSRTMIVAIAFIAIGWRQLAEYRLTPEQWATLAFPSAPYFDNDFTFHREVAVRLADLLRPGETFWNFGEDNTLYFAAHRSPPTGLLYLDPLVAGSDSEKYWNRLMTDLNRAPPDLIIVSMRTFRAAPPTSPIFPWMKSHYVPAGSGDLGQPTYRLFVRRESNLSRRLNDTPATGSAK